MRKEERLFLAIGAADPALLERSERRRKAPVVRWGGLAAAACLAVLCTLAVYTVRRTAPPVTPDTTPPPDAVQPAPEVLALTGGEIGELHLVAIDYGPGRDEAADDFILYINEEIYCGVWEEGGYAVRPRVPSPEGLPECSLTVSHRPGVSLEAALEESRGALEAEFSMVEDQPSLEGRAVLNAWVGDASGAEWDAANAAVTLVDDRRGGVFVLTARYFTEAAEGHGVNFSDMAASFQPIPADVAVPAWMTSLRETVDALLPAVFCDNWTPEAQALLAEDASVDLYGEDVSGDVSIAGVDIIPDDDQTPSSAVVSVRHRISTEDSMTYVTMLLNYVEGRWLADSIGLEK